jgi:hypothetical protein
LKTLATQEEMPSSDEEAIDAMIEVCGGDARIAPISHHVMAELRSYDRAGCASH